MPFVAKGKVEVQTDRCKGCALCVDACNFHLMHISENAINGLGYHAVIFSDPENKCSACALCVMICPDLALTVFKQKEEIT